MNGCAHEISCEVANQVVIQVPRMYRTMWHNSISALMQRVLALYKVKHSADANAVTRRDNCRFLEIEFIER